MRSALVVATSEYEDPGLRNLTGPLYDARALADILKDPLVADFEVTVLLNEPNYVVGAAIGDFYRSRKRNDLTLLYISGHGLKDDSGHLYFAMRDTRRENLLFTALSAHTVNEAMEGCYSQQKVLILDCCYSGAFGASSFAKGDPAVHTLERFRGRGRIVLTASDSTQYAFESDPVAEQTYGSIFTRFLVEGISTGAADIDLDGDISVSELYSFAHDRVFEVMPNQRPKKHEEVEGNIVIARNVAWEIPSYLRNSIDSPISKSRLAALEDLAHLHRVGNDIVRAAVEEEVGRLTDDDSRSVSVEASRLIHVFEADAAGVGVETAQRAEQEAAQQAARQREAAERQRQEQEAAQQAARQRQEQDTPAFPPSSDRLEDEKDAQASREAQERARREAEQIAEREAWRPSRSTAYFAVTAVLAILGILLAFFGPESPITEELTWDVDSHTTQARADLPEGTAGLSPTLLGLDLPRNPIPLNVDANTFDIGPQRLFLAGPAIAEFHPSGKPVRLVRSGGSWWSPLLTIPGVVMVLGALFSFAYGESLLRSVRKRRGTVRTGELVGMAGAGAVLGGVITVAGWIAGNVPAAAGVLGVVFCLTAAAGLLPYAVAALPQHRDVTLAAVPLAFLTVLSITWTAVGIGGQGDPTPAPSPPQTSPQTSTQSSTQTTTPPPPPPKWQRGTDLPEPLEAAGVTVFGDAVWVVGGNAPSAGRPKLDKVWFHKNGWQPGPKLPVRLDSMAVASNGKRLFVVGGQTSDSKGRKKKDSRVVWVLDGPDDDSWQELNRLPEERSGGAVAWDGQRLVFAGGLNHQDLNGDGEVVDAETVNHDDVWVWEGKGEWRPIGQLQRQREDLVAASDGNGRVWFLGGADVRGKESRVALGAVDLVEKDRITPLSDIDPVRSSSAVWLADRGVCLFGGVTRTKAGTNPLTNKVVCVPETASPSPTIRPLPPLTLPRAGVGAAVQGETIWLVGGFGPERKDGPVKPGRSIVEVLAL